MRLVSELMEWSALSSCARDVLKDKENFIKNRREFSAILNSNSLTINLTHQLIDGPIFSCLQNYSKKIRTISTVESIFHGKKINVSENNIVTHALYRSPDLFKRAVEHQLLSNEAKKTLSGIKNFVKHFHEFDCRLKDVVNIGIGGSDLGPKFVIDALRPFKTTPLNFHFVSNIDPYALSSILNELDPKETAVIISSKSFGTFETIENANLAVQWLSQSNDYLDKLYAITERQDKAINFGIKQENILPMHKGVGGRFSVFSSMGALVALAIGFEGFLNFLKGGNAFDQHVLSKKENNIAHLKALVDFWNINFLNANSQAIIPYSEQLRLLVPYLQQLMMESNGKSVSLEGRELDYKTCPIIWGGVGSASQHSFHQLLMQGTNDLLVDFIEVKRGVSENQRHQLQLNNQLFSQSRALWFGNSTTEKNKLKKVKGLQQHSIITLSEISASSLGMLLAFYEYQTIYLGRLWGINSFDQPGVELGKRLSTSEENLYDVSV